MTETALREKVARLGKSMFDRGLTFGSSGNISVRLADGWLMTPTGTSLGRLILPGFLRSTLGGNSLEATRQQRKRFCTRLSTTGDPEPAPSFIYIPPIQLPFHACVGWTTPTCCRP